MDVIVYYTADEHGTELMRTRAPQPVVWECIGILARYPFRRAWLPALLEGIMVSTRRCVDLVG